MICKKDSNTYVIVYNGQLYNTKELREELEADNFTFESYSDTEVLLKSYIKFGYNVVNKLMVYFHLLYGIQIKRIIYGKRSFWS